MTPLSAGESFTTTNIYYAILSSDNSRYNKLIPLVGTPYYDENCQWTVNLQTLLHGAMKLIWTNYQDAFFNHYFLPVCDS